MDKTWKIVVGERALEAMGTLDETLLNGKEFSHSFLALINPEGKVVEELHGQAYNKKNNTADDVTLTLRQAFNLVCSKPGQSISTNAPERLRVVLKETLDKAPTEGTVYVPVLKGGEAEVMNKWKKSLEKAKALNDLDLDYIPFSLTAQKAGQNCHSVTSDCLQAMEVKPELCATLLHADFIRPGFQRILSSNVVQKGVHSLMELKDHLRENVTKRINNSSALGSRVIKRIKSKFG